MLSSASAQDLVWRKALVSDQFGQIHAVNVFFHMLLCKQVLLKPLFFQRNIKNILCLPTEANSSEKKMQLL